MKEVPLFKRTNTSLTAVSASILSIYNGSYYVTIFFVVHQSFQCLLCIYIKLLQCDPVNADIDGTRHSVRIKRVNFAENIRAFFLSGQTKLSVIYGCMSEEQGSTV